MTAVRKAATTLRTGSKGKALSSRSWIGVFKVCDVARAAHYCGAARVQSAPVHRVRAGLRGGYTLIELLLVIGLMAIISALVIPNFARQIRGEELRSSADQLRSFLALTQANAAFDGKRYRIRFATENEQDPLGGRQQPLIEREDDPIHEPEVFNLVTQPWAVGKTLIGEVRCAEVRLGRPKIADLIDRRDQAAEDVARALKGRDEEQEFDPELLPLYIEPDGTSRWATFVLTEAPAEVQADDLEDYKTIEVILEGLTGLCWLQRPFYDEELDLFADKGWPAVLRQDFLRPDMLTEDDVLELREIRVKP